MLTPRPRRAPRTRLPSARPRPALALAAALPLATLALAACDTRPGVSVLPTDGADDPLPRPEDAPMGEASDEGVEPTLGAAFSTPARGPLRARSGAVGGPGGAPFEGECGPGQVLAGVRGAADALVREVVPLCVDVDATGAWTDEPAPLAGVPGGGGAPAFERTCLAGSAIVDLEGAAAFEPYASGVVGSFALRCRELAGPRTTAGRFTALAAAGGAPGAGARYGCGEGAVATGLFGRRGAALDALGLVCLERPGNVGRWSDVIDWPLIPIHAIVAPDGRVMTYGTTLEGAQGAYLHYDVWDPAAGTSAASHLTLDNTLGTDMFCSASVVLPESGEILLPGGDGRFDGAANSGVADVTLFDPGSDSLSSAASMAHERWYATSTTLADGDVLVVGGIDAARNYARTPEVYSAVEDRWRSLLGVDTAGHRMHYPRQWVAPDGRVFGIGGRDMYYIDTAGDGALEDAGRLPDLSFGWESTAVMYRPGRILQLGGGRGDGRAAIGIDIAGPEPAVSALPSPSQSRKAWADSVVLPDGTVLVVGGSPRANDATDASLSAELFDPEAMRWTRLSDGTLPRLYHSTATLLPDGRVLVAGGGAPGPLINRNAELFSPPYLFDDAGGLAERPRLERAPDRGAYGEDLVVGFRATRPLARATLVKTGAVTHSFDMEQRFLELPLTVAGDRATVSLPSSRALATPGHYLLHLLDADGVPSTGHVIRLGDEPAPEPPPAPTPTPVPEPAGNLLANGGFERDLEGWLDCAAPELASATDAAHSGAGAARLEAGGCLYQEFAVEPGRAYAFECTARTGELEYAALSHLMYDAGYAELAADSVRVVGTDYATSRVNLAAPPGASIGSVNLYADGVGTFDGCSVRDVTGEPAAPPDPDDSPAGENLLANGDFENGDNGWFECAEGSLTNVSGEARDGGGAMAVEGAGCLYQEFPARPGATYAISCDARSEGPRYTSLSARVTDGAYVELASTDVPIGRDAYDTYRTELGAPADAVHGAVTLYSEDRGLFDNCAVIER